MYKTRFTLVELLMVVTIIVILAAVLIPAIDSARSQAKRTQAQSEIKALETAITQYETTYGILPAVSDVDQNVDMKIPLKDDDNHSAQSTHYNSTDAASDFPTSSEVVEYKEFIYLLQNYNPDDPTKSHPSNPRGVRFLEIQDNTPGQYNDPWYDTDLRPENKYHVVIDYDYNKQIDSTASYSNDTDKKFPAAPNPIFSKIAIWSIGEDAKLDTSDSDAPENEDNVVSWD